MIAKNPTMLTESYTPPRLVGRGDQQAQLEQAMRDAVAGGDPARVHVHGPAGSGKTTLVRSTLAGHAVIVVHVDCGKASTAYRAMANAANHLTPSLDERVPFTGIPIREVAEKLRTAIARQDRPLFVVLDGIDELATGEANLILGAIRSTRASVVLISKAPSLAPVEAVLGALDARGVHVPAFTRDELREILASRIEATLGPDAMPTGRLDALLSFFPDTNARNALALLRSVVETATDRRAESISTDLVVETHRTLQYRQTMNALESLDPTKRRVLDAVLQATVDVESVVTGDAYAALEKLAHPERPITMRRFTDILGILHEQGLIVAEVKSFGRHGRTKIIRAHEAARRAARLHPTTATPTGSASA